MDTIKIENFGREYPNRDFPDYKTLSVAEAEKIAKIIAAQLKMLPNSSLLELVKVLEERSSVIPDIDADSDDFDLKSTILKIGVSPKEQVFINWYRFDQIDEISLNDLSNYFDDIWYLRADYINVFDDSFSWIISIGYSGETTILKFSKDHS